jgi:hypothetical protein
VAQRRRSRSCSIPARFVFLPNHSMLSSRSLCTISPPPFQSLDPLHSRPHKTPPGARQYTGYRPLPRLLITRAQPSTTAELTVPVAVTAVVWNGDIVAGPTGVSTVVRVLKKVLLSKPVVVMVAVVVSVAVTIVV